jgi:carbonic anhydrase/acetyltransferase-like protein (isoleucine patch superfamily)
LAAEVHPTATVYPGTVLGEGARVRDAVIGAGVAIESGAIIEGGEHAVATLTR